MVSKFDTCEMRIAENERLGEDWAYADDPRARSFVLEHVADAEFDKFNRWRGRKPARVGVAVGHRHLVPIWVGEAHLVGLFGMRVRDLLEQEPEADVRVDVTSQRREIRMPVMRWLDLLLCDFDTRGGDVVSIVPAHT